jgi:hypothetical protein
MKPVVPAALFALALSAAAGPAMANHHLTYPDRTPYCHEGLCFVAGKPYLAGAYGHLRCADPMKFLTYVGPRLVCKPR